MLSHYPALKNLLHHIQLYFELHIIGCSVWFFLFLYSIHCGTLIISHVIFLLLTINLIESIFPHTVYRPYQ